MIRYLIAIVLFAFFNKTFSQDRCLTLEDLVKQTLQALEKKDTNLYLAMWDKNQFIKALRQDTDKQHDSINKNLIQKVDLITKIHRENFKILLNQLEKQFWESALTIDLIKYEKFYTGPDKTFKDHGLEIIFTINGHVRKLDTPIMEYKNCFYYFEPISTFLLDK